MDVFQNPLKKFADFEKTQEFKDIAMVAIDKGYELFKEVERLKKQGFKLTDCEVSHNCILVASDIIKDLKVDDNIKIIVSGCMLQNIAQDVSFGHSRAKQGKKIECTKEEVKFHQKLEQILSILDN